MSIVVERAAAPTNDAAPELSGLRILIVHEWLYTWAGAERVLEHLTQLLPGADVLAGIVTHKMRREHAVAGRAIESWVGRLPFARTHHRWFLPAHALAFATFDTSDYDLIISVSHAFEKAIRVKKRGAVHLSYCLSPPRYLWDLSKVHDDLSNPIQRFTLRVARAPLRVLDRSAARGVHHFVSLSQQVADRVWRAYRRKSSVVYPPVARKISVAGRSRRDPFLLTLGRLVPYKRVDLAIAAAERLGIRLVVAGEGPERGRLQRAAGPNTEFLGWVSEKQAVELLSSCGAFVFCAEEDFGIAAVEANAHGSPVVAYARGGALETIRGGTTGVFFQEQTVESLATAIQACLSQTWDESALRANADRFAPDRFRQGIRSEINKALARTP